VGLKYPPEWKFDDDLSQVVVPGELRSDALAMIKKVARSSDNESWVVEAFKHRFGNPSSSSSLSWAYSDLSNAMDAMTAAVDFAEAFWLGIEDARSKGHAAPNVSQVNKLYAKHDFPFFIDPPNLHRTYDQHSRHADKEQPQGATASETRTVDSHPAVAGKSPDSSTANPTTPSGKDHATPELGANASSASPVDSGASSGTQRQHGMCFVAQPFKQPFQGRFEDDVEPAIKAAGLIAYKVDMDLGADKLIEDIHAGIRRATVVLVDITEDNPNVWYELGYSQALGKPLVMISCANERPAGKPYPFDVRGRRVINYQTGRSSDHRKLANDVTETLRAILAREASTVDVEATPPIVRQVATTLIDVDDDTLLVVRLALEGCVLENDKMPLHTLQQRLLEEGLTSAEVAAVLRKARSENYIVTGPYRDDMGNQSDGVGLSKKGDEFVVQNFNLFKRDRSQHPKSQ
jgi:hypothetical protein